MIQLLRFLYLCVSLVFWCYNLFMDLQITKLHSLPLPCALAFYFPDSLLCCYKFCGHSNLFIFLRTTICSCDFKSLARSQLIIHYLYKYIYKIPPMTCPHLGRVTDGIVPFYGYSYVVQEFPFPAFASGFIASTEASSPMPS